MDVDLTSLIKLINQGNVNYELTPAVPRDTTNKEQSIGPVPAALPPPMGHPNRPLGPKDLEGPKNPAKEQLVGIFPIGPAATEYGMKPSPAVKGPWPPKEWLPKKAKSEAAANIGAVRTEFPPAGVKLDGPQKIWPDMPTYPVGRGFWGAELKETLRVLKKTVVI